MTKCDKCGKEFRGYDDLQLTGIDDEYYCPACLPLKFNGVMKNGHFILSGEYYRVSHTFSSMYDGPHEYKTKLEECSGVVAAVHYSRNPLLFNWGFGLSGHIDSDHWELYSRFDYPHEYYIYTPSAEELEKLKKIEITVSKLKQLQDESRKNHD